MAALLARPSTNAAPLKKDDPTAVTGPDPRPGTRSRPRSGDASPITHCVYIIKENRTYDQVFGDMPQGNGEPSLCLFPEEVTPNHHALVREFVLLDNFYVESEVSADGHEWTMGAYATDFVERTWPLGYRGETDGALSLRGEQGSLFDRPARRRLPLGPRRGQGCQLPQLRRVRQERHDPGRPRAPRSSRHSRATSTPCSAASTWTIPT